MDDVMYELDVSCVVIGGISGKIEKTGLRLSSSSQMADYDESKGDTPESPGNPKKFITVQPSRIDRNPKEYKTESKENEPPRRNPMCQMSLTLDQDGASTSGCTSRFVGNITKVESSESDDDELPIISSLENKKHIFKPQAIKKIIQEYTELENKKTAEVNAVLEVLRAKVEAFENGPRPALWVGPYPSTMKDDKHLNFDQIKENFDKHRDMLSKIFTSVHLPLLN